MYYKNIVRYDYDALGRVNSKTMHTGLFSYKSEYTYISGTAENSTTSKVASIKNNNGAPITYEYDTNGNITKITQGLVSITYYYNELNELIQEDNQVLNKTVIYSYDEGGNLMSKLDIPNEVVDRTTIAYEYDSIWKDKLLKYNGKSITYDAIGNPLSYDGYTYTWEEGRQLKTIVGNSKNISFKYNDAGIRTEKNVDGVVTKYTLLGNRVAYETNGTDVIYYTYDDASNLVSMNLNGVEYYYIRNAQGDIIGLFDKNGTQVVSYVYDSWGRVVSTTGTLASTVGVKNPYRYRGYRYDAETGLYYLQSRYYNPEWGRFINIDSVGGKIGTLLSHNMVAYCFNNPVNMSDTEGRFVKWNDIKKWASNIVSSVKEIFAVVAYFHPGAFVIQDSFPDPYNGNIKALEADQNALKQSIMIGVKGIKVSSKTVWQKGKTERIDIENPAPGKRPGDVHYHESNDTKWRFNIKEGNFIHPKTKIPAPNNIQKLLERSEIQKGINTGLKYLGEVIRIFK